MSRPAYADLGHLKEDDRIKAIGEAAMRGKTVGFVTDADPGKADRYIAKIKAAFPHVVVIARFAGPVRGAITVKVGPSRHGKN